MQLTGLQWGGKLLKYVGFPSTTVLGPEASVDDIKALIEKCGESGMSGTMGLSRSLIQGNIIQDINYLQVMPVADLIIILIMCGGNLQCAGPEFMIHIIIAYERDLPVYQGNDHHFPMQMLIPGIFRVHRNGGITQDGFRPGCGNHNSGLIPDHLVPYIIQFGLNLQVVHLLIGNSRFGLWIPVDHANPAIDISFIKEVNKNADHRFIINIIHSEPGPVPIA